MRCPDPKSLRLRDGALAIIDREIAASGNTITFTEAVHRAIERSALDENGKFLDTRVYLVGALASRQELEYFAIQLRELLEDLEKVRARLGGPLNPETIKNSERRAEVEAWRKLAKELPARIIALVETAERLGLLMNCGITSKHYAALRNIQQSFEESIAKIGPATVKKGDASNVASLNRLKDAVALFGVIQGAAQAPLESPKGLFEKQPSEKPTSSSTSAPAPSSEKEEWNPAADW